MHLGDVFQEPPGDWSPLTVWLGKDVAGRAIGADLAKMPHLLVAGTTGAGKSGAVNAMLSSILLRATPHEVRMVLVDPKQVELNHYDSIPHLLTPVITSPRQAATALQNLVREMEQRYSYMSLARTRSLVELNKVRERRGEPPLPYVLCVIDELADLMMVAPADVEDSIIRIAQKARAVGIHLVLATQSPARGRDHGHDQGQRAVADRLRGVLADRLARDPRPERRRVAAGHGRHALLARRLLAPAAHPGRVHRREPRSRSSPRAGAARASRSSARSCSRRSRRTPRSAAARDDGFDPDEDPLLGDAIRLVAEMQTASTSMLQRRLRLGYTRAGRLIDMLERRGVISGYEGSKPRQVLVTEADLPRVLAALDPSGGDAGVRSRTTPSTSLSGAMPEIGETLREARMRRRIDMAEVESATKIRAKYLRALESEEWELLPGPTFVKTFLRTYAEYLELDARLLVEEYKQRFERPAGMDVTPLNLRRQRAAGGAWRRGSGPGLVVVLGIVALLGALYLLGVSGDDDDEQEPPAAVETRHADAEEARRRSARSGARARPGRCACSIVATGQVYVCMEDARGRAIVDKRDARGGPAHAHVPRAPLQGHVRHRGGADPPERQDLPRGRRARTRSATSCARAQRPQRITSGLAGCT